MQVTLVYLVLIAIEGVVVVRIILRPYRDPSSRIAWLVVVIALPVLGVLTYLLVGETNIGSRRAARVRTIVEQMPGFAAPEALAALPGPDYPSHFVPLFRLGESINGFAAVNSNTAQLMDDSNSGIDAMVADMDAAREHIHVLFYIWLSDTNGMKVVEALKRAAGRGVTCRALADGLGSRTLLHSQIWTDLQAAGVHAAAALKNEHPLLRPFDERIDLRNHRKIVVIDDQITYCGSQNCADPEFRVKPKFAPWVDILLRFEGPIARQNQHIFAEDWMTYVDEDIRSLFSSPPRSSCGSGEKFAAQVIATGPTVRNSAMSEIFTTLMYAARRELLITTPYYVPNESMQAALCAAAYRGVKTTIVFPARNDSREVGAASRSYYHELLLAGVAIHEYTPGLLHAKTMTVDGEVSLVGSANMDRRSMDLNYENNILFYNPTLTHTLYARQQTYLASARIVTLTEVEAWSLPRRLVQNTAGMLGPLL